MKTLFSFLFVFTSSILFAQDIEQILANQVAAFNTQAIDDMVNNLDDDFQWLYVTPTGLVEEVSGKEAIADGMGQYYSHYTSVQSNMVQQTVHGDKISFLEEVKWESKDGKSGTSKALGVYQFKENKIWRVWYF